MSDLLDQQYRRNERARQKNKQEERKMVHDIESKNGIRALHEYRVEMVNREQKKIAKELERIRAGLRSHRQRLVVTDQEKEWKRGGAHPLATARSEKSPLGKQSVHRPKIKTKSPFSRHRPQAQLDPFPTKKLHNHPADRRSSKLLSPMKKKIDDDESDSDNDSDVYSDDEDHSDDEDPNALPSPEILKAILKGVVSCWEETVVGPLAAAKKGTGTSLDDAVENLTIAGLVESTNPRPSKTPRNSIIPEQKRINPKDLRAMKTTPRPSNAGLASGNLRMNTMDIKMRHNSIPALTEQPPTRTKNGRRESRKISIASVNSASTSVPSASRSMHLRNINQIDGTLSTDNNENGPTKEKDKRIDSTRNDSRLLANGSHKTNHINNHSALDPGDLNTMPLGQESSGKVDYDNKTRSTTDQLPLIGVTDTVRKEKATTHDPKGALNSSGEKIYTSERQGLQPSLTGSTTSERVSNGETTPYRFPRTETNGNRLPQINADGDLKNANLDTIDHDDKTDTIFKHNNKISALITSSKSLNSTPREDLDNISSQHKSKTRQDKQSSLSLSSTPRPSRPFNKEGDKVNINVALPPRTNSAWSGEGDNNVINKSNDRNEGNAQNKRDSKNSSPVESMLDDGVLYKNPKLHVYQGSDNGSAANKKSGNSPHPH